MVALLLACGAARAEPDVEALRLAQQRFDAARGLYEGKDYAGALTAFRISFSVLRSPNTALYMARCLRQLGKPAEAALDYELAARLAASNADRARYAATGEAATAELAQLEAQLARLTVRLLDAPAGTRLRLDGELLPASLPLRRHPVAAGRRELVVEAPGLASVRRQLELRAGAPLEVELALRAARPRAVAPEPLARPAPPRRLRRGLAVAGFTTAGLGVASLVASIVCWRLADTRFDDLSRTCGGQPCPESLRGQLDEGRRYQLATNVTLGVGIGLAAAGAALLTTSLLVQRERAPRVSLGVGGVQVGWQY